MITTILKEYSDNNKQLLETERIAYIYEVGKNLSSRYSPVAIDPIGIDEYWSSVEKSFNESIDH
jgi:hypothetical protein